MGEEFEQHLQSISVQQRPSKISTLTCIDWNEQCHLRIPSRLCAFEVERGEKTEKFIYFGY